MTITTKLQPVFILLSALVGLILGYLTDFGTFSAHLIEPFLMVLLFFVFLSVNGKKFQESFRNVKFTLTAAGINFILTPLFAWVLGILFFPDSIDLHMGLVMLLVTPCTDWYLVFTGLSGGNVELGASILPMNLLLQILLMPLYLFLFFGGHVSLDNTNILINIVFVLLIPFSASLLIKIAANKFSKIHPVVSKLQNWGDDAQLFFLCLAIISMFASESKNVFNNPNILFRMLLPLAVFFTTTFIYVRIIGNLEKMNQKDMIALNFTTLARNSPLSLAIAVAAFSDRPLISLALVIGPLIELPVLGIFSYIVKK